MLKEIMSEFFEEQNPNTEALWNIRDNVEAAVEQYKAGAISCVQLDDTITNYVYEAQKQALKWMYAKCAMAVFGHMMMDPESLDCAG